MRDKEGVGDQGAAEYTAGFEIRRGIGGSEGDEGVTQRGGEEERAQGCAIFGVSGGLELVGP